MKIGSIVMRILLLYGFAFCGGCSEGETFNAYVDLLGERVPERIVGCRCQVVTNALVATDDSPYIKSEWRYSPMTGKLVGVKKYSRVFAGDLSRGEKGRLMSTVQRQLQPRVVGLSSVLTENADGSGEIKSESGVSAKVAFIERGRGTQMLVDIAVTEKYISQRRCRMPGKTVGVDQDAREKDRK